MKKLLVITGIIFMIISLSLARLYNKNNVNNTGLPLSVEFALASHPCNGSSCHAYDVGGTLKCDDCCTSGTPSCTRVGGCGCTPGSPDQ